MLLWLCPTSGTVRPTVAYGPRRCMAVSHGHAVLLARHLRLRGPPTPPRFTARPLHPVLAGLQWPCPQATCSRVYFGTFQGSEGQRDEVLPRAGNYWCPTTFLITVNKIRKNSTWCSRHRAWHCRPTKLSSSPSPPATKLIYFTA
ncbi:hypothetical protein GW17_00037031 [Ensete ventricosum]|nr:hypothetical protein GW17_00037031 [Ensete ventricosum]